MHIPNILLSHWVSNEAWVPTALRLYTIQQKYSVIHDIEPATFHRLEVNLPHLELPVPGCIWQKQHAPFLWEMKNWNELLHVNKSSAEERLFRLQGPAQEPLFPDTWRSLLCSHKSCFHLSKMQVAEARRPALWDERKHKQQNLIFQNCHKHLGAMQPEYLLYVLYILFCICASWYLKHKVSCNGWHDFS